MIAVVTGASGFIGRNLVGRLRDDGYEVRVLARTGGGRPPADFQTTTLDLRDPQAVRACGALDGADAVFHLAAATRARSAAAFAEANVVPTRNLLEAVAARGKETRFVLVSSQAAAGPARSLDRPVVEEDAPHPVEDYGRSKLEAERIAASFGDRIPVTIARPCSVFGPHDRDFLRLFAMARRGVIVYPGVADHWMSLLHVADVVDGLVAASREPKAAGRTYFLAAAPVQWRALGTAIANAAGRAVRHVNVPAPLVRLAARVGDVAGAFMLDTPLLNTNKVALTRDTFWVCSGARAEKELRWKTSRSLPDAARDTYLWYRESGWLS